MPHLQSSASLSDALVEHYSSCRCHMYCYNLGIGNYSNSGVDLSSYLKTDNSSEFSSSCTTRIVPILTTGVSFLRSYKVSKNRPIMGCPRSVLVSPGQSQDGLGMSQASPSMVRSAWA